MSRRTSCRRRRQSRFARQAGRSADSDPNGLTLSRSWRGARRSRRAARHLLSCSSWYSLMTGLAWPPMSREGQRPAGRASRHRDCLGGRAVVWRSTAASATKYDWLFGRAFQSRGLVVDRAGALGGRLAVVDRIAPVTLREESAGRVWEAGLARFSWRLSPPRTQPAPGRPRPSRVWRASRSSRLDC